MLRDPAASLSYPMRGFTLPEMVLVLVLLGLLLLTGLPPAERLADQYATLAAARRVAGAHDRARILSIIRHRVALLTVDQDSLRVALIQGPDTTVVWRADGPARRGVALAPAPRMVRFAPLGIAYGFSNVTFTLTRGSAAHRVIVSRLGRVRLAP